MKLAYLKSLLNFADANLTTLVVCLHEMQQVGRSRPNGKQVQSSVWSFLGEHVFPDNNIGGLVIVTIYYNKVGAN